jgi:hypothetical protein
MKYVILTFSILAITSIPAMADMDIPVEKVTAYSGACKGDHLGGGAQASNQDSVVVHNVENARKGAASDRSAGGRNYAIAAVPQAGSKVATIFNCFFKDESNYPGVTFRAGDHYAKSSNGKARYDASHACQPFRVLNAMTKPATKIVIEGECGGVRGGKGDAFTRSSSHPKRKHKMAPPNSFTA